MQDDVELFRGGELLLDGFAVAWFASAVEMTKNVHRRNGVAHDPRLERWAAIAREAVTRQRSSAIGTSEVPIAEGPPSSALIDPIDTAEAADMLNCTTRNVLGLRARGAFDSARKVGGQWQYERADVAARAAGEAS